jgi:hypothetical protein
MDDLSQASAQRASGGDAQRASGRAAADLQGHAPQPLVDEDPFVHSWVSSPAALARLLRVRGGVRGRRKAEQG